MIFRAVSFLFILFLSSCATPRTESYQTLYAHLNQSSCATNQPLRESDNFLVILVDARHLDYTNNYSFLKTMTKHPSDGSKNRDVGHSWIYLRGIQDGQAVFLEGGHSGELGVVQSKYFDGIMNYIDFGYATPTSKEILSPRIEPNPVKYLWETQHDGYFQWGSGGHSPTYAVKLDITSEQFELICSFITKYRYREYAITGNQCSSFVAQVASLAGLDLACEVTMDIQPCLYYGGRQVRLWSDPLYSQLTISSPDILEKSMMQAAKENQVENALQWYQGVRNR